MKYYAGIGSRETPADICELMVAIAGWLQRKNFTLRSGGAVGADRAFALGAWSNKELFLPWIGFNGHFDSPRIDPDVALRAVKIAEQFHPAWEKCNAGARKMHTRNVYQILGADLETPSQFVVCWTKDGKASGGTGQALRIAASINIPIFNLHDPEAQYRLHAHVA